MSIHQFRINTDNTDLIGELLRKEHFVQQNSSLTFTKQNLDQKIQIDLSYSFPSPSIICCCSTISTSLPQLLSYLDQSSSSIVNLILFVQSSETVEWNSLMNSLSTRNLSLNVLHNKNQLETKLVEIIEALIKQNQEKTTAVIDKQPTHATHTFQVYKTRFFLSVLCIDHMIETFHANRVYSLV